MSATGAYRSIILRWTNPSDVDLARVQVWVSLANDRDDAVLVDTPSASPGMQQRWVHTGREPGVMTYYWIRPQDYSGNLSTNYTPTSPTAGWSAAATGVPMADVEFPWTEITGTSQDMDVNAGYIANNAALVSLRLPLTSDLGDVLYIAGKGAGGWRVTQRTSQQIHLGASQTTVGTGGVLAAPNPFSALTLRCITANTIWEVTGGAA